jgi:hypothetical protein
MVYLSTWNCSLALWNQDSPLDEGDYQGKCNGGSIEETEVSAVVVGVSLAWWGEEFLSPGGDGGVIVIIFGVWIVEVHASPNLLAKSVNVKGQEW